METDIQSFKYTTSDNKLLSENDTKIRFGEWFGDHCQVGLYYRLYADSLVVFNIFSKTLGKVLSYIYLNFVHCKSTHHGCPSKGEQFIIEPFVVPRGAVLAGGYVGFDGYISGCESSFFTI